MLAPDQNRPGETRAAAFVRGFVDASVFGSLDPSVSEYSTTAEIPETVRLHLQRQALHFYNANEPALTAALENLDYTAWRAGVDFWYTRNRHLDHGYQVRRLDDAGEILLDAAREWRTIELVYDGPADAIRVVEGEWPDEEREAA